MLVRFILHLLTLQSVLIRILELAPPTRLSQLDVIIVMEQLGFLRE